MRTFRNSLFTRRDYECTSTALCSSIRGWRPWGEAHAGDPMGAHARKLLEFARPIYQGKGTWSVMVAGDHAYWMKDKVDLFDQRAYPHVTFFGHPSPPLVFQP